MRERRRWRRHDTADDHDPHPGCWCDRRRVRHLPDRRLLGGDEPLDPNDEHLHARAAGPVDAAGGHRLLREPGRNARSDRQPGCEHDLHRDRQGRILGSEGRRRQPARRRRHLDLHHRSGWKPAPDPGDHQSESDADLEGRRQHLVRRASDGSRAGGTFCVGALVDAPDPALPLELPHAYPAVLAGRREWLVRRPGSRVSVVARAEADCYRRRRSQRDDDGGAESEDRRSELRVAACGSPTRSQQHLFGDPVSHEPSSSARTTRSARRRRSLSAEAPMRSRRGRTPAARPTTSPPLRPPRRTPRRTRRPLPAPRPT